MPPIESTPAGHLHHLSIDVTEPRQTPPPPGRRFAEALGAGVSGLVDGAAQAVTALPGGTLLAAALRDDGGGSAPGIPAGGGRPEGPGGTGGVESGGATGDPVNDMWRMQQQSQEFNVQFLQLQEGLSQENRRFSALSNVLKARHDTAKSVIQNIR